jgi:hypothetical protein
MIAGLAGLCREKKRAAVTLSTVAVRMSIMKDWMHAQSDGAMRRAIGIKGVFAVSIEWDRCDAAN